MTHSYTTCGWRERRSLRGSFTLVELLISVAMIALLASMSLFTLYGVMETARERRTRAQIDKVHSIMMRMMDDYRSRPIRLPPVASPRRDTIALRRLLALRETMRMELPDRITDVVDNPVHIARPALSRAYVRAAIATLGTGYFLNTQPNDIKSNPLPGVWSFPHEGSECLYLILANMRDGNTSALDFFATSEFGDVDADGMKEILDAWGRPIEWLRWAPGFATLPGPDLGWGVANFDDDSDANQEKDEIDERGWPGSDDSSELQSRDFNASPDPFDPLKVDPRWRTSPTGYPNLKPYALIPLIFSYGRDGQPGIHTGFDADPSTTADMDLFHYSANANDPYYVIPASPASMFGKPHDTTADDNITNHLLDNS